MYAGWHIRNLQDKHSLPHHNDPGPINGQVSSPIIFRSTLVDDVSAFTVGVAVVAADLDMGTDHVNLLNLLVNLLGVRRQLHLLQHRHLLLLLLLL